MKTLNINGDIVSDDLVWIYDWYEMPCFSPKMARDAVSSLEAGETLRVVINSPGGDVYAGQEPLIIQALDAEMIKHPGELQKSLKSTGIQEAPRGYYVAYRATGDSKNGGPSNPEKMIYLINREYIRNRNGTPLKKGYAIPAYDVISDAIRASESSIYSAMENEFNEILDEIWGGDD